MGKSADYEYEQKLILRQRIDYPHHRSGWPYAIRALEPLLNTSGSGVLLDTMIEKNFYLRLEEAEAAGEIPYLRPWIGFVHSPLQQPEWFAPGKSLLVISKLKSWQQSRPFCRGLITLSRWLREQIQPLVEVPLLDLKHPTETPEIKFSFEKFLRNPRPRVIQVGWWLRRLCSIYRLPVRRLKRTLLMPHVLEKDKLRFFAALEAERRLNGIPPLEHWDVEILPHQPNDDYDELLSRNIVFLDLYAGSASNAIVECIVRHTPVLVNRQPWVVEYLGESYPCYFETLEEAAAKAEDFTLLRQAHEYLVELPKYDLSAEHFCRSLAESDLYRNL